MQDFEVMIPVVLMMIVECLHRALKEDVDILASDLQQANPKNGLMHVTIKREKDNDKLTCNMIRYSHVLKGKWNGECAKEMEKKIENIILPLLAVAAAAAFFAAFFFCFSSSALILATLSTLHSHA